jgi:hypothetical protein
MIYRQTIPNAVLDTIVEHRPDLAAMVENLRNGQDARQIEPAIARAYLYGETRLSATDTWYLSQVANNGPWGGDWWSLDRAAHETGYDDSHLRRLAGEGKIDARKYGRVWYVQKDSFDCRQCP